VIQIRAITEQLHCRWRISVEYLTDTGRSTMTISAPGDRPFEATARSPSGYSWRYVDPTLGCLGKDGRPARIRVSAAQYAKMTREHRNCP
jgi:hypothetical protein